MTPGTVQRARCRIGGLIFLLAAAPAGAQEAIIVTGSRTGPDETSTAVVTAEDIERTQPVTALEPLDRVAGVRAFSKGGLSRSDESRVGEGGCSPGRSRGGAEQKK